MYRLMPDLSKMVTIVLSGGLGSRLRPVVSDKPKVLASVHSRPFLTYLLDQLVSAKARKVVLCTGYMADTIQATLGDRYRSLKIIYSQESGPLGTGGAVRQALPHLDSEQVLIMNGDSFVNVDLTDYVRWFCQKGCPASLTLVNVPNAGRYGKVTASQDGLLLTFEEKLSNAGPGWINAGIYIMKRSLVASMPAGGPFSLEHNFFPDLLGKGLYGFFTKGEFIDIGTPESYRQAEAFFLNKGIFSRKQLRCTQ